MAKNVLAAQVNTSLMEGTEATYTVDVRDYCGAGVDISLVTLACEVKLESGELKDGVISWDAETSTHILTLPELPAGRHSYEVYELLEDGEHVALVQGWLGVFTFDNWQEPEFSTLSPNRTLRIALADEKGHIEASWIATAAAEGFAYKAKQYALELRDAMPLIEAAAAFMKSFDEALREHIKVVNDYLWIGGVNTGHYLRGADGETPRYGNDGWWYIGSERVGQARGDDGITPHITSDGYWAFGSQKTNVRAAGKDGINGSAMRRVVIDSIYNLPQEEERGVYYYVRQEDNTFEVYVWLENAGWTSIGPANNVAALNLATASEHGMMKFSAGEQTDGAPVGWKQGDVATAIVPLAGTAVAGTGKISTDTQLSNGGLIGLNSFNQLMVHTATTEISGTAKLSTSAILNDAGNIGVNSSGQLQVPRADSWTWGVVRLSTYLDVTNTDATYLTSIGKAHDGTIAFNLLSNGAIKYSHGNANGWKTAGAAPGVPTAALKEAEKYLGLSTSAQFNQDGNRLNLNAATTSNLAGVYLATSMTQTGAYALTGDVVVNYLSEHYYGKSQVYTKQETLTQIEYKMQSYATLSWVQDNFMTRTQIQEELRNKVNGQSGVLESIKALTASQRQNLTSVDSKTLYLVYAG